MNVKTYNFVKYVATLGIILVLLAPLLGFLQAWSEINGSKAIFQNGYVFKSGTALAATLWVLEIVGIILIVTYTYVRNHLKNKSEYVYTKKDNYKLNLSYIFYGVAMIISLVYVAISCGILGFPEKEVQITKADNPEFYKQLVGIMIAFAPLYVAEFTFAILSAIFESMSRIQEQVFLYAKAEDEKKASKVSVSKSGTKRTKEAQALLADEEEKATKHKSEEYIEDQKELEDFFHEDDDEKDNK